MDLSLDSVLDAFSWACILISGTFLVIGGIGVMRLPDFFCRQHASGLTDTLASGLLIVGLLLQVPLEDWGVSVRLILIMLFLLFTSPTASHALAQAALSAGVVPQGDDWRKDKPASKSDAEGKEPS